MTDGWQTYFQPDESLLWEGAPLPGIHRWGKVLGLALVGMPFLAVGVGTGAAALHMLADGLSWGNVLFGLFGTMLALPLAGFGLILIFATTWRQRKISAYPILKSTPTGLETGRRADTVWFHVTEDRGTDDERTFTRIGFDNIAGGDHMFRLIRSIQTGRA